MNSSGLLPILDAVNACVILTDEKNVIQLANQAACELLEWPLNEIQGRQASDILSGESKDGIKFERAQKLFSEACARQQTQFETRILLQSKKGKPCTTSFSCTPLNVNGEFSGTVITFSDIQKNLKIEEKLKDAIQEQIKNEQQLRDTQEQLLQAEKLQSVGRLAAGVAHEVKNPIAIILQGIEYLQSVFKDADEDTKSVMQDLIDAVMRADKVIKSLLDYATPKDAEMETSDVNVIIEESLILVKHLFTKREIYLRRDFSKELSSVVLDRSRMQQVFINLFSNAVHAMPDRGEICIKTRPWESQSDSYRVIIEIEDTGTGVPKEILQKIFDPFLTTRRGRGGTGLGLSVVRGIIQMHNGDITIENKVEGGARVTIKL